MSALRPLLLLTRPEQASRAFWEALPESARASAELLINPLMSIHVTGPLPDMTGVKRLIFTSANGLDAFRTLGGVPNGVPAIAVGENTATSAAQQGFEVDMAGGNADRLVEFVQDRGFGGPLLHIRGDVSIGDVAQRLTAAGVTTREAVLYEQRLERLNRQTQEALSQDRVVIAPVFSQRTARQLRHESGGLPAMAIAAISQPVADELSAEPALCLRIAKTPNRAGMVELVAKMIADAATLERPV
jgi:uroporphyrinogen-III synthase